MDPTQGTIQLPPALSTTAANVDFAYYVIYWISVLFFVGIVGSMLVFIWKYRRRPGVKAEPAGHHTRLEIFWTFSPLILLAFFFYIGFAGYMDGVIAPAGAHEVRATAKRWSWEFKHMPRGASEPNQLAAPAGEPVKVFLSSVDVLHSFFVPAFRIKRDAVPGMYSSVWFQTSYETRVLDKDGSPKSCDIKKADEGEENCGAGQSCMAEYKRSIEKDAETGKDKAKVERIGVCHHAIQAYCTEYCGAAATTPADPVKTHYYNHSSMYAKVLVLPPDDYQAHVQNLYEFGIQPPPECQTEENPMSCWGHAIYVAKACSACHTTDGSAGQGPSFKGVWGRVEAMSDGTSVNISGEEGENYIRESVLQPPAKVVSGFQPVMPSFAGILSDPEIDAIIAYLKSLGTEGSEKQ